MCFLRMRRGDFGEVPRMTILAACFFTPFLYLVLAQSLPDSAFRRGLGPLLSLGLVATAVAEHAHLSPAARLLVCSLWLLYTLKGWALLLRPRDQIRASCPLGLLLFAYVWPGLDPGPFARREPDPGWEGTAGRWFALGFPTMALGIAGLGMLALNRDWSLPLRGFATIGCLALTVHFGYSDVLSSLLRLLGYPVPRLFDAPLRSRSLNDFWSRRWNRPFVEMNQILFRPALKPLLGQRGSLLALFLLSGLLHEMAISFPAGAGWGGPLAYFVLHGGLMLAEKRYSISTWPTVASRAWTWFWLLAPLPLLFHTPFRDALVLPLLGLLEAFPAMADRTTFMTWLLTCAGWGHFLVLVASFQVPHRLGWREELPRLRPLNRKIMWVYGGYIATMIALLGIMTLNLIPEMLGGEKGALTIAALAALFWWSRVIVDALVFEHADWPEGPEMVLGHTLLTSLFVTLASIYTALLVWQLGPF